MSDISNLSYDDLLQLIARQYNTDVDNVVDILNKYNVPPGDMEETFKLLDNTPYKMWYNSDGTVRSTVYNATGTTSNMASDIASNINSNTTTTKTSFNIPISSTIEKTSETVSKINFKAGMKQAGNFVFGEIAPRVAAVATGITLGKTIDKALYNVDPLFWDEHGMSSLDPETWGETIGTDNTGSRVANVILGTTPEGTTQAYLDENLFAYMGLYLQNKDVFKDGTVISYPDYQTSGETTYKNSNAPLIDLYDNNLIYKDVLYSDSAKEKINNFFNTYSNYPGNVDMYTGESFNGSSPFTVWAFTNLNKGQTINIKSTFYQAMVLITYAHIRDGKCDIYGASISNSSTERIQFIGNKINNGNIVASNINTSVTQQSEIDGIETQEGAKTPDLSGDESVEDVLNTLKDQYPELWDKAISQDVVQPDGSVKTYTYVPVAMPDIDEYGNPITSSSTQSDPQVQPETATKTLLDLITKIIQRDPPTNPPDTGDGDTPPVIPPTGSASSLYAIYNPTLSQINSFGAWLWSDNFVDQIKKLFNDPMQAIIGLHKVYAPPATGGSQTIKVGYLDSGVSARVVSNQYTTIDCGTVRLSEQFHNVFDYSPYTEVNLYLPFIGIVNINVADVMRASIHIVYHVDVLSGACLAEVKVTRDSAGGTLYQYAGNASVTLPISSGSYMGIVSAVAGVAGGIAGTIASGGSALPLLASSAGAMFNAHTQVEHSGGFSGNAGAMGGKIPYLIISRPQTEMADGFENYIGYPSNFTSTIGSCNGFVKVLECHLENINATNSELNEIDSILKEGVIL